MLDDVLNCFFGKQIAFLKDPPSVDSLAGLVFFSRIPAAYRDRWDSARDLPFGYPNFSWLVLHSLKLTVRP